MVLQLKGASVLCQLARVLVIEDDPDLARGICMRLRAAGLDTIQASDGAKGFSAIAEIPTDLIVLDIRMPNMSGLEFLARLGGVPELKNIPVIVTSANVAEVTRDQALALGARAFLEKPFRFEDLLAAIALIMKGRIVGR